MRCFALFAFFGQKYRRNVLTIKWLQVVLAATAKCCHRDKLGYSLRTGSDNAQEHGSSTMGWETVTNAMDIGRNERRRSSRHEASNVIRNELRARTVMQERRSKFVWAGEGHIVPEKAAGRRPSWKTFHARDAPNHSYRSSE